MLFVICFELLCSSVILFLYHFMHLMLIYLCLKSCFLIWMRTFVLRVRQVASLCIKRPVFGQCREPIHILEYTKSASLWIKIIN